MSLTILISFPHRTYCDEHRVHNIIRFAVRATLQCDPKTLCRKDWITMIMCFPGIQMQGLDHLYLLLPSIQCLIANQFFFLYVKRVETVLSKVHTVLGETLRILIIGIPKKAQNEFHLRSRKLSIPIES